jgi:hypothetical protein
MPFHDPFPSHPDPVRAFVPADVLARIDDALEQRGYLTHEFGDSVFVRDLFTPASAGAPPDPPSTGGTVAQGLSVECAH